jgi:KUP system potassium uptake protein
VGVFIVPKKGDIKSSHSLPFKSGFILCTLQRIFVNNSTLSMPSDTKLKMSSPVKAALTLAALGVVFGDIGTSPLYALRACFTGVHGLSVTPSNILGSVSLIIWLLIVIVSIKYVIFVMRADNKGEGGILSLMALVHRIASEKIRNLSILSILGIIGAALLFSDGVITPAISVLSAIEGVSVVTPALSHLIIPIALAVLTGLFLIQFQGTSKIGRLFGPIVLLWFVAIGILGLGSIISYPKILYSLNPFFALILVKTLGLKSLLLLGAAFLAVTGAEVLYADMGHFGKSPIRIAWFYLVFPALVLNYLGQGAKLLYQGKLPENLFYSLSPSWFLIPLIFIATLATVIASQAVISGAFSLFRQSVQLGFWPRIKVLHTSKSNIGQVYLPFVNISLYVVTFLLIVGFKESGNLASAYGIAVSATMLITTLLIILIAKTLWKVPIILLIPVATLFLLLDASLFVANLSKFSSGGWIVVVMAVSIFILMTTWIKGRKLLQRSVLSESVYLEDFVRDLSSKNIIRTPKTAVFLSGNAICVPRSLLHNFKHNGVIHSMNLIVSVQTEEIPHVNPLDRFSLADYGYGIYKVIFRYGFMESPNIPIDIANIPLPTLKNPMELSYFLGKESLIPTNKGNLASWRKQLYLLMARNSLNASTFFNLPVNRVVELGVQIEF